jgi:hypothetical protein
MEKEMIEEIKRICEDSGWGVSQDADGEIICIETWSDSGEDICIEGFYDTEEFLEELDSKVREFDIDEYVDLFSECRGKNGVPSTYEGLIKAGNEYFELIDNLNDSLAQFR